MDLKKKDCSDTKENFRLLGRNPLQSMSIEEKVEKLEEENRQLQDDVAYANEKERQQANKLSIREDELRNYRTLFHDSHFDKKQAEERLARMFLNYSHENRNHVGSIIELMPFILDILSKNEVNTKERVELSEHLTNINLSAKRIYTCYNNIAVANDLDNKKYDGKFSPLEMNDLGRLYEKTIDKRASENAILSSCDIYPNLPDTIGNEYYLEIAFDAFLDNAIKFGKGNDIYFSLSFEGDQDDNGKVTEGTYKFELVDRGVGIPQDKMRVIWDFCVQGNNSTSRSYDGFGLGLNNAKRALDKINGEVKILSYEGEGTRVMWSIPFDGDYEKVLLDG